MRFMAHVKRVPLRKCTGCGEMKPKKDLVRVVKSPEGEISLDLTGRKPAFACAIPAEVYDRMEEELTSGD